MHRVRGFGGRRASRQSGANDHGRRAARFDDAGYEIADLKLPSLRAFTAAHETQLAGIAAAQTMR
jgi:hypothetical protein